MSGEWFRIAEIAPATFVIEEPGHVQYYLVNGAQTSALIDTGMGFCDLRAALKPLLRPRVLVLNTHWHYDHVGGNALFTNRGISSCESRLVERDWHNALLESVYLSFCRRLGVPFPGGFEPTSYTIAGTRPTFVIEDGDVFDLGGRTLRAIATPGHTHGSLSYLDAELGALFCGDFVYRGELYAHLEESDLDEYIDSLTTMSRRAGELDRLLPCHDATPLPASFLTEALAAFEAVRDGCIAGEEIRDWGESVIRYRLDGYAILGKPPGAAGIGIWRQPTAAAQHR
jgi:glyoxylase-like metal-dependent hydrolase (beta-lactamase superfamily II)